MNLQLNETYSIILALCTAVAAGLMGSFALMRRMSLAGDVISHIALPGLGLALLFHLNPLIGGGAALLIGTLLIWQLERRGTITVEVAIGVIFTAALAIGVLVTPSEELIEALFGGFVGLSLGEFIFGVIGVALILVFILKYRHQLILSLFSPELASATGVKLSGLSLAYLLFFSLTVLLGLRFLGALLMGALIIVPAAIGRQLTHTLSAFLVVSTIASVVCVSLGFALQHYYPNLQLGPVIIAIAAGIFLLSLLKKKV